MARARRGASQTKDDNRRSHARPHLHRSHRNSAMERAGTAPCVAAFLQGIKKPAANGRFFPNGQTEDQ
jgi:hypothetical protein